MSISPHLRDEDFTLYNGDAREVLSELPAESVHMCVTSPPFFGLRDYGTGAWEGGDDECDHLQKVGGTGASTLGTESGGNAMSDEARERATTRSFVPYRDTCGKCGATRTDRQIGLEATPEEWVASLVLVFEEVRRVLRRDGTLWVECGDSYASGGGSGRQGETGQMTDRGVVSARITRARGGLQGGTKTVDVSLGGNGAPGCKPKDLIGQPFLLAFALREAGWYWRNVCIWHKPNPMPESVRDRFTVSHSYVLLFSKSPRYFFDAEAVRETMAEASVARYAYSFGGPKNEDLRRQDKEGPGGNRTAVVGTREPTNGRNARSVWTISTEPLSATVRSVRQIRVAADEAAYGMTRTTSPDCPVHAGLPGGVHTPPDGERAGAESIRSERSDVRRAQEPPDGSAATSGPSELAAVPGTEDSPVLGFSDSANPRSSEWSKRGLASETSFLGSASAQTADDTGDTSTSPAPAEPQPSIGASRTELADSLEDDPSERIADDIARRCTCSYTGEITEETGHYAAFPQALAERCIKAGSSERGCCPECGAPWVREVEKTAVPHPNGGHQGYAAKGGAKGMTDLSDNPRFNWSVETLGWRPSCEHSVVYGGQGASFTRGVALNPIPCTVLDPFLGSGTTALVARRLNRRCIGVELSERYCGLAAKRTQQLSLEALPPAAEGTAR